MPAAPRSRLAGALAVSAAVHAAVAAGLQHTGGGPDAGPAGRRSPDLQARLIAAAPRETERAASSALPLPGPHYYRTSELDIRPQIMTRVEPIYPEAAARRFLGGRVVVGLDIDEAGKVERVRAVKADPPGYFEASAEKAFAAARFTPGMKGGRVVKVRMMLEVSFDSAAPPDPAALLRP
jgi:protein TonB